MTDPVEPRLSYAGVRALSPADRRTHLRRVRRALAAERARRPDRLPALPVRRRRAVLAAVPFGAAIALALLGNAPDDDGLVLLARFGSWLAVLVACVAGPVLLRRSVGSPDDVPESELTASDLLEHRRAHRTAHHLVLGGIVVLALLAMADHLGPGWQVTAPAWVVLAIGAAVSGAMLPSAVAAWRWTDPARGDLAGGAEPPW